MRLIIFLALFQFSCKTPIRRIESKKNSNSNIELSSKDTIISHVFVIDNVDEFKLGFDEPDVDMIYSVSGLTFLDENTLVLSDTYHRNLKIIDVSKDSSIKISKIIPLKETLRFANGDCCFFNNELYVLGTESGDFAITNSTFDRWNIRTLSSSNVGTAAPYFCKSNDSLFILSNAFYKEDENYYSCIEDQNFQLTNDKKLRYNNYIINSRDLGFLETEIKKVDEKFELSPHSQSVAFILPDGSKKYALINLVNDDKQYVLYIIYQN